jgi:uncharacterized protein
MYRLRATLFAVITFVMTAFAFAAPNFPTLTGRVVDGAHILSADNITILSNRLRDFEDRSGHQMAVATVPSLEGLDIRDYGYQLGRQWALGAKGKNDGVLILVAPNEHKASIEVGYGMEGDLTDAVSSVIISHAMVPKFKAGDYFGGLYAGIGDVEKVIGGQAGQVVAAAQNQTAPAQDFGSSFIFIIIFIFVLFIIFNASRGRGVVIVPGGSFGGSSGWSSGGGGWSGGGGGFSGGGGSFGGGGASGGW